MPDSTRRTVSATEAPALLGVSPYLTKWMLYRRFHDRVDIDPPEDARMTWGKKLEPLIMEQAAADLKMEIIRNDDGTGKQAYHRRGVLGCSRDAIVICPDRGPGTLETKCVFEYGTWMRDWGGGSHAPKHYEIQTQQQMYVGEPDGEPYRWGVIAAWVAGEIHYFERHPIRELWAGLEAAAKNFLDDVAHDREPDPFGAPIEVPLLSKLERRQEVADLTERADLAVAARMLAEASAQASAADKMKTDAKARLLAAAGQADELLLPDGIRVKIKQQSRGAYEVKPTTFVTVKAYMPEGAK